MQGYTVAISPSVGDTRYEHLYRGGTAVGKQASRSGQKPELMPWPDARTLTVRESR
jgi:hypothetical protein